MCLADNSGFATSWLKSANQTIIKGPKGVNRSPIGTYADASLFPYANSSHYYFKGTHNIFSKSIKNAAFFMSNYKSQVNGSPQNRIISWAFPPQGCPKQGCPVLILFPGGANHAMNNMQLNPNDPTLVNPAETVFSDAWDWPESKLYPRSGFDFNYGYYVRMKILQAALEKGYAVIGLNPEINPKTKNMFQGHHWDDWSFSPQYCPDNKKPYGCQDKDSDPSTCDWKNADSFLWPGSDKGFLNIFFKELINTSNKGIIYKNHTSLINNIEKIQSNKKINLHIDIHHIFLIGYSSGAQMVSRMINEFALPFPTKPLNPHHGYNNAIQDNQHSYWLPTINGKYPDEKKPKTYCESKVP